MQLNNHGDNREQMRLLQAISKLQLVCPDQMETLISALETELSISDVNLRGGEGPDLHRGQGVSQTYAGIIEFVGNARTLLNEFGVRSQQAANTR